MSHPSPKNARVVSGVSIGAVVAGATLLGGWIWTLLLVFVFYPIAYKEMLSLMAAKDIHPSRVTATLFSILFYVFAFLGWERHFQVIVTMGIIFTFAWLLFRKTPASICDIGGTILMFFYLGFLPAHFIVLRQIGSHVTSNFLLQPGLRYLFLILFIVSASDVLAYYAGKRFGKNLLSPQISPKKTIEGAAAGALFAIIIAIFASILFGFPWVHGAILGVIIAFIAQIGDLSESLLKRDAGIKDSGNVFPGHGGILDRTDSYIFSGAVGYYYILWFVLHQGIAKEIMEFLHR